MTNWQPEIGYRSGPRYRAIADAIAEDVATGRLAAGARLPTHRDLAYALGVTVGTVTRAYAEAERQGLIGGEVGRGTFVRGPRWLAMGTAALPAAAEFLESTAHPAPDSGQINLSVCQPSAQGFESAIAGTVQAIIESGRLGELLAYGPHGGMPQHRAAAADWLVRQHRAAARPESLLLTVGAQNGMAVALATVARPGDLLATETLTYHGAKAVAATLGLRLEGLPMDEQGLRPESFEALCRHTPPRALYCVPTLQNPTALVMPADRRVAIATIARRYGVTLIEDDVFGFLAEDAPPPIQTLAPDVTIYLASLSKSVAAGLRLGFLLAPPALIPRLEAVIRAMHYSLPQLVAEIATRWINDRTADRFAEIQRNEAGVRQALARRMLPAGTVHGHPKSFHFWLTLPEPWRREEFVGQMLRRGVTITGADAFVVGRVSAPHAVRVSLCMPVQREEAVRGLSLLADTLAHPAVAGLAVI
jgi:DNA-binding transcriptional MocR family regulator